MPNKAGERVAPSRPRSASPLPLRRAPVCAVLLRCMGGFGGGLGVIPRRRFRALCGGCGGVLGGQFVQYAAGVFGGDGLLHKGLELLLGQRDGAGQQLFKKPHALAKAVCPVLALLDQPLFAPFPIFVKIGRKLYATKNFSGGGHSDVHLPFALLSFKPHHAILFLSRTSRIG